MLRVFNEPTAASLAYGFGREGGQEETILVWDLGGGTFDVSLLELGENVHEVKATNGDTHLGGDDWDERIVNYVADQFQREQGIDLRKDRQALQRLREAAEKAKVELSTMVQTSINLPFITADQTGSEAPGYEPHAGEVRGADARPAQPHGGSLRAGLARLAHDRQ